MAHNPHHEHLIIEVSKMLQPVLAKSTQAIYVYLDDEHKICNKKFADLLGYKSPQEWVDNQYPISDVDEAEQEKGIKAYMEASNKFQASVIPATWIKKDGKKRIYSQNKETILPLLYLIEKHVKKYCKICNK